MKKDICKVVKKELPVIRGAGLFLKLYTGSRPLALNDSIKRLEKVCK